MANGLFATYKWVSEAKLQCKLNLARSSRSSDPTKVWVEWFAKVLVPGDIVQTKVGINPLEICMVEGVEHLRSELQLITIGDFEVLHYGEIKVLNPRSPYDATSEIAELPNSR